MTVAVAVLTRDLRIRDNPVLTGAIRAAAQVVPLFVLDDAILGTANATPNRLGFLLESLHDLDRELRERSGRLVVRRGDWVESVLEVAKECGATEVHVARDVSGFAKRRLADLEDAGATRGVEVVAHESVTVVPPGEVEPSSGGPFLVFTPYYKRWRTQPWRSMHAIPRSLTVPRGISSGEIPKLDALTHGQRAPDVVRGGESEGHQATTRVDERRPRNLQGGSRRSPWRPHIAHLSLPALRMPVGTGGRHPPTRPPGW